VQEALEALEEAIITGMSPGCQRHSVDLVRRMGVLNEEERIIVDAISRL